MKKLLFIKCILLFAFLLSLTGCRKDGKGCWQAFSPQGYDVQGLIVCGKTKAEAEAQYPQYWFYRSGERKYCWQVQEPGGRTVYAWDTPESMAAKLSAELGFVFTRKDCNSFCVCDWSEKHKSKVTGQYGFTLLVHENLLSADTCSKLSVGKVVVVRETNDSLITRELINKKP